MKEFGLAIPGFLSHDTDIAGSIEKREEKVPKSESLEIEIAYILVE